MNPTAAPQIPARAGGERIYQPLLLPIEDQPNQPSADDQRHRRSAERTTGGQRSRQQPSVLESSHGGRKQKRGTVPAVLGCNPGRIGDLETEKETCGRQSGAPRGESGGQPEYQRTLQREIEK